MMDADSQIVSDNGINEKSSVNATRWNGYKFVGDNVDKNLRTSFQRSENHGLSVHCFHGYAIRDRVNFEHLSELSPLHFSTLDPVMLIPSDADVLALKKEFCIVMSRYRDNLSFINIACTYIL